MKKEKDTRLTKKMDHKTWEIAFKFHHFASLFLVALATAALYLTRDIISWNYYSTGENGALKENKSPSNNDSSPSCDFYSGKWIYDNVSYPLYEERRCSFMQDGLACEKYGRKDLKYRNWRWQPHHCDLPRFNGTAFLEKLRGKKLIFVGDSMSRNQMVSMLCLIESSLPPSSEKRAIDTGTMFYFQEYNATIGAYWSPYLVESNCDDQSNVVDRVVMITAIEKHARNWNDADILVFDSYAWWLYPPNMTISWGSFERDDSYNETVEIKPRYYEMALNTWSDFLEMNIDRTKTMVFFMSATPYIFRSDESRSCYNVSEPTFEDGYFDTSKMNTNLMDVAEKTVRKLAERGINLEYVRISEMSANRRDAHPSIYRKFFKQMSEEDRKKPKSYSDCIHWCLPGVPDIWNLMLYAHIMKS